MYQIAWPFPSPIIMAWQTNPSQKIYIYISARLILIITVSSNSKESIFVWFSLFLAATTCNASSFVLSALAIIRLDSNIWIKFTSIRQISCFCPHHSMVFVSRSCICDCFYSMFLLCACDVCLLCADALCAHTVRRHGN